MLFSCLVKTQSNECAGEQEEKPLVSLLDIIIPEEFKRGLNFTLPKYRYCGPGTPTISRLTHWKDNRPINKLDLACFYHDLALCDKCCTYAQLRWADYTLIKAAKDIYEDKAWENNFLLKIEAKTLIGAIELKIKLEDLKLFDSKVFQIKTHEESRKVGELMKKHSLPEAWDLSFYYENTNVCKPPM